MNRPEMQKVLLDIAERCMSLADTPLEGKAEVQANKIFKKAQKLMRTARRIDDEQRGQNVEG